MRKLALATALLACGVGGCSEHAAADPVTPAPAPAAVVLPGGYKQLLPTVQKTGDATLPPFTPQSKGYTLLLRCDGEGSVTVQYNDERGADTWPCDGVLNHSKVYVDGGRQQLHVRAGKTTVWSAGIVDGLA